MFKEGICPKCRETIQVPEDREKILCMYCGQEILVEEALGTGEAQEFSYRLSIGKEESIPNLLADEKYADFWAEHRPQCRALAAFRRRRWSLHRDDKVLTSWNAMMIAALAKADRVLGEERYLKAAQSARLFLKTRLTQPDGRLWLRWRDREAASDGACFLLFRADF